MYRPCLPTTAYLGENVKQMLSKSSQKYHHFFGLRHLLNKSQPKSSQTGEK
jgi:hypothetical protein